MDGNIVKVLSKKRYSMIHRTRDADDFYCLMGRFFGSRAIAGALGMPIYDDEHRLWLIILNSDGYPVACASVEKKPASPIATLKSAWVEPGERGNGLYDWLFRARLHYAEELPALQKITSTATEMSKHTHERYGFRCVGTRGKYYTFWKEVR